MSTVRQSFRQNYPPVPEATDPPPRGYAPAQAAAKPGTPPERDWEPSGLKRASQIPQPAKREPSAVSDQPSADKSKPVTISTEVMYGDMLVRVAIEAPLSVATLKALQKRLRALGLEPIPPPLVWTADGKPMCPRHHVVMSKRDKQGDVWYSHACRDEQGNVIVDQSGDPVYCRGYSHKSSPGWDLP